MTTYDKGVSIIIPICNAEEFLKPCLKSVTTQTLKDIEIICILDKKSDDKSEKILKNFAKEDKRIKVIKDTTGKGQGYNRNLGIEAATKEYIGFVDADDYLDKDYYERLLDFAHIFQADIVQSDSIIQSYDNKPIAQNIYPLGFVYSAPKIFTFLKDRFCWDKIYRTELVKDNADVRFAETTFYEDAYFVLKAAIKCNKLVSAPGSNYFSIRYAESLMSTPELREQQLEDSNTILQYVIDIVSRLNNTKSENKAIFKFMVDKFGAQALKHDKYRDSLTKYIEKLIRE